MDIPELHDWRAGNRHHTVHTARLTFNVHRRVCRLAVGSRTISLRRRIIVLMNDRRRVETIHNGSLFTVEALSWTDPSGRPIRREIVRHPGAVVIVPALDDEHLVMIRNFRIAVNDRLLEFPAGKLEPGEHPRRAALRELEEETGYTSKCMRPLGSFYTSPGFTDELMHAYVAEQLSPIGQRLEAGEDIEVRIVHVAEAMHMAIGHHGTQAHAGLRDGKSIAALLMWKAQGEPCTQKACKDLTP